MGPWAWLLELSPELPVFWVPACCPSCPLWGAPPWPWLPMLPKGGKEVGFADGIPLPGCPEDVTRLLDDAEPFADPLLLLLLLGTEEPTVFPEPCWLTELEAELDSCVDDDWLDEGEGLGCVRRELSNGCDARYGAKGESTGLLLITSNTDKIKRHSIYSVSTSPPPTLISSSLSSSQGSLACHFFLFFFRTKPSGVKGGN